MRRDSRPQVPDRDPMFGGETLGDQRSVAGFGIAFYAQQGRAAVRRKIRGDGREIDAVKDLLDVPTPVFGRKLNTASLPDSGQGIFAVLEMPEFRRGSELATMLIVDVGAREGGLKAQRVRPRVVRPAHASALPHVEYAANVSVVERGQKRGRCEPVDADGRDRTHLRVPPLRTR